jgi:molecular chaperone GrpE
MEDKRKQEKNPEKEAQDALGGKEKMITVSEAEYLKLKESAEEALQCRDRILRLQADFENTRKRLEKEKLDYLKFANEGLIAELLIVLDDLERAVDLAETKHQDLSAFLKGVEMILAHLYEMLKDYGVKPIEAQGKLFDPNLHEALMQAEDNEKPEHTVIEEMQKGYFLNDRVIRTAKVKVSKISPQSTDHSSISMDC